MATAEQRGGTPTDDDIEVSAGHIYRTHEAEALASGLNSKDASFKACLANPEAAAAYEAELEAKVNEWSTRQG